MLACSGVMGSRLAWLVIMLCCWLLLGGVAPLHAAPTMSVSNPVGLDIPLKAFPGGAYGAAAASDGNSWLVAYRENSSPSNTVSARRFGSDGAALGDAFDLRVGTEYLDRVQVVFDGVDFIVAWIEGDSNGQAMYFTRVSTQGAVLTPAARLDALRARVDARIAAGELGTLAVVCGSGGYCRSWLINHDGEAVEGAEIAVTASPLKVTLGFSEGTWLAIFDGGDVQMAQFAGDGALIEGTVGLFGDLAGMSSVASSADGFVAALTRRNEVRFVRVGFDGTVAAAGAIAAEDTVYFNYVELISTPEGYALFWTEGANGCLDCQKCRFQILSPELQQTGPERVDSLPYSSAEDFAMAPNGKDGIHLWSGYLGALHFGDTITVEPTQVIGQQSTVVDDVRAAPAPGGWLVAWHEVDPDGQRVRAQLVDAVGVPSGAPFDVNAQATSLEALSRGESGWLVAVGEGSAVELSHISDAPEITHKSYINSWLRSVSFTSSRNGWLARWTEHAGSTQTAHARRFDAAATTWTDIALGRSFIIPKATATSDGYVVTWEGDDYQAAYADIPGRGGALPTEPQHVPSASYVDSLQPASPDGSSLLFVWGKSGDLGARWLGDATLQSLTYNSPLWLVSVDGLAVAGIRESGNSPMPLQLAAAAPDMDLTMLGLALPRNWTGFSQPSGNSFLITFVEPQRAHTSWSGRPAWQVVQVDNDAPPTGEGGAGGVASEIGGGASTDGGTDNPASGGAAGAPEPSNGSAGDGHGGGIAGERATPGTAKGGMSSSNAGEASSAEGGDSHVPSRQPRTSRGCGCRVAGSLPSAELEGWWLALLFLGGVFRSSARSSQHTSS